MFLNHDQEYKAENADIEVAIPISGRINLQNESTEVRNLKEPQSISVVYTDSYQDIGIGYTRVFEYAHLEGYQLSDQPTREVYLNDPNKVDDDQLMTEIQLIVEEDIE